MHDMSYDYVADEIVVPQFFAFAILTFDGGANGNVAPKRIIMGPKTQLDNPHAVTVDPVHGEIFVPGRADDHRVLVFDREAEGDVAPTRILELDYEPDRLGIDPVRNLLVVTGNGLDIFDRTASGKARPLRSITPPEDAQGLMAINPENGMIFATGGEGGGRHDTGEYIGVWSVFDNGNVPPRWKIGLGILKQIRGVALDAENQNVIVTDKTLNAILTFHVPEAF
jgi:hypothetical protein